MKNMDKGRLHHFWRKLKPISPWSFLVVALIFSGICVWSLRENNLHMIRLRDAVYAADKENGDVEGALRNLREYVYAHMNTDLSSGNNSIKPPIQLKYEYERLVEAQKQQTGTDSSQVYTDAQAYCEANVPDGFSGRFRIPCIQDYVAAHGAGEVQPIPDALFKFDFVSPLWSPDVAGWSLVIAGIFGLLFLVRLGSDLWLRYELRD